MMMAPAVVPAPRLDARAAYDDALLLVPANTCHSDRTLNRAGWALKTTFAFVIIQLVLAQSVQTTLIIVGGVLFDNNRSRCPCSPFCSISRCGVKGIVRILVIAPFFVMPTVSALVWKNMFMGPVNGLFAHLWKPFRRCNRSSGSVKPRLPSIIHHCNHGSGCRSRR